MNNELMVIQIAVASFRDEIPADKSLVDRLKFAMSYVKQNENNLFWMIGNANDDLKFRTAIASIILTGSDEDRDLLERSMQPLKMLSAAMSGVPVAFEQIDITDDLLPLVKIWDECT